MLNLSHQRQLQIRRSKFILQKRDLGSSCLFHSEPAWVRGLPSVSQRDGGISGRRQKERIQKDDYLHLLFGKPFRF